MNHSDLVSIAAKWLQNKHAVVITEIATLGEEPDAIGWRGSNTTLVECKASRADFLADRGKYFRRFPETGIGRQRYFLTVPGIIKADELPERWGLLELTGRGVRVIRPAETFPEINQGHEASILLSAIRRIGKTAPTGMSIKYYTLETRNRATLGAEVDESFEGGEGI